MIGIIVGTNGNVEVIHNQLETLTNEEQSLFIQVDSVPQPEQFDGKGSILKFNVDTNEFYYEYVDVPPTPEDDIAQLKQSQLEQDELLMSLLLGGMM